MPDDVFHSHMFRDLLRYGHKESKFQQREPMRYVTPISPGGVCLGVTMDWITEQLKADGNPGVERHFQSSFLTNRTKANEKIMRSAIASQRNDSGQIMDRVAAYHQIRTVSNLRRGIVAATNEAVVEGIVECSLHRYLPSRRAVMIGIEFLDVTTKDDLGPHLIAFHRDSRGRLYFFDPNAGVYVVRDVRNFINAWLIGYETGGRRIVRINRRGTAGYDPTYFFKALEG